MKLIDLHKFADVILGITQKTALQFFLTAQNLKIVWIKITFFKRRVSIIL